MTVRGCTPRNDQRPTLPPCSADSSRNDGPSPRSFRYADTGVSMSSMNVWRGGPGVCARASSRTSSSVGPMLMFSAATGIQHAYSVNKGEIPRRQQDFEVVQEVSRFFVDSVVRFLARRASHFLRLLFDFRGNEGRVFEQASGIALPWIRPAARRDGPLEGGIRLVRGGCHIPVVEARP